MERQLIRRGSDNPIELRRLYDEIDEEYQEGATVTCDLLNSAGAAIAGADNISMAQVSGTSGRGVLYLGELSNTLTLPEGAGTAVVKATSTIGKVRRFLIPVQYVD